MVVDCCLCGQRLVFAFFVLIDYYHIIIIVLLILTIHPTIFYYHKVENVTVNDGTHVGGFRGGDVLVPSNYDEIGGVAKVGVSNNMNQSWNV